MVTYNELFQYSLVLIAVIGLVISAYKKKQPPCTRKLGGYFFIELTIEGVPVNRHRPASGE